MTDAGRPSALDAGSSTATDSGTASVRLVGRMSGTSFEWEGSSVLANFSGTEVTVTMSGDPTLPNYFAVFIDGAEQATLQVTGATATAYPLATALDAGAHSVELFRRDEASQGVTQFVGFDFGPGGAALALPAVPTHRIEFIGDSITAGYGDECANASIAFTAATENEYLAFGSVTARAMNAEAHIVAWSGEGVYRNNTNIPDGSPLMPEYWLRTLPTIPSSTWDFTQWTPDVVVVNLGTNDFEGTPPSDIQQQFQTAFTTFMQQVHSTYPKAYIFCTLGPVLTDPQLSQLRTAINGTITTMTSGGFSEISLLEFPTQNCLSDGSGCGCDYHPSSATQARMATALEAAIQTAMGW